MGFLPRQGGVEMTLQALEPRLRFLRGYANLSFNM
jgi:hypothetical protein